jgi:hypothetical protein
VAGIARDVLPAQGKRALNKFLTEYYWDEQQFNHGTVYLRRISPFRLFESRW